MQLVSDSWPKWSNAPWFRSPVVDEGKMRRGHWFGQRFVFPPVLWQWQLGDRKDIRPTKKLRWRRKTQLETCCPRFTWKKRPLNGSRSNSKDSSLKCSGMALVNEESQFYLPPTGLSTSGMNHTCLYSPAAKGQRTLVGTHFLSRWGFISNIYLWSPYVIGQTIYIFIL